MIKIGQNTYKGKRCFIIASGPSIKYMNLDHLRKEVVICVNESYKALKWHPDFICIGDRELWPYVKQTYMSMKSTIIACSGLNGTVGMNYHGSNLGALLNLDVAKDILRHGFHYDLNKAMPKAWSVVPEVAIPFACWAGFDECYLLGCDCTNSGHFYDNDRKQLFDDRSLKCYKVINDTPKETKIYNATMGGRLNVFPRVNYNEIFTGIQKEPVVAKVDEPLIVAGYYTPDKNYKELAFDMKATVDAQGLECEVHEWPSAILRGMPKPMPWVINCALCGPFVRYMMNKYPKRPLLYLDADASMMRRPDLILDGLKDIDFAAPILTNAYVQNELQSNTLYFNCTPKARQLVEAWCSLQEIRNKEMLAGKYKAPYKEAWDQRVLQDALSSLDGIKWQELPWTYGKIDPTKSGVEIMPGVINPVICQHQASRQNKATL